MMAGAGSGSGQSGQGGKGGKGGRGTGEGQSGTGGSGSGKSGDDANTGPKGKLNDVKDVSHSPSALGDSGTVFSAGTSKGAPTASSPAAVPYTEVYSNYKKSAESALNKEKVPPAYRNRVKDYFSSLE